ncbi:uncharacterized protein LOC108671923 [Hyalella azteca]|uniref:Uncharacterized protein LOC108671923 n=1 Tax=Hyalella azteca TaxID=294128 RepID=A0A8B7NMU9_HYAAZ|nr:uncharacterized protein LOC108671923 [Hyalella azteca]
MSSIVNKLLYAKKYAEAVAYVTGDNVRYRKLEEITVEEDKIVVYGEILSIKKYNPDSTRKLANSKGLVISKYDRLVLFREVVGGSPFYVLCQNQAESNKLFWRYTDIHIGCVVAFFEPIIGASIHGIKQLSCISKPVPVRNAAIANINTVMPEFEELNHIQCFTVQSDICIFRPSIIRACASRGCDSQHMEPYKKCPSFGGGRVNCISMHGYFQIKELSSITEDTVQFCSESLAAVFIHEDSRKMSEAGFPDIKNAVEDILAYYKENQTSFLVSGWYKRRHEADNTPSASITLHLSSVRPQNIIVGAPLFRQVVNHDAMADAGAPVVDEGGEV